VTTTRIGDLDAARVGSRVSVQGDVADAKKFSQGLRVTLDDGSGTITVLLWSDTLAQITNADQIQKGAHMQALGKLNQYRGDLEVVPNRGSDVQVIAVSVAQNLETPATSQTLAPNETPTTAQTALPTATSKPTRSPTAVASQRTIGSLTNADENKIVIVNGKITSASPFSSGTRYKLDDGTGTITLILFSDVLSSAKNSAAIIVGARVQATGKVNLFNNALEIVPAKSSDVVLLAVSSVPTPAPRTIASITSNDVDAAVIISGNVTKVENFSKGKYVTVNDGTGEMRVTIFSDVLSSIANQDKLAPGAKITVRGKVNLFQGKLELMPDKGGVSLQ
jgi:DNA/RNA endonuclease YhcR with UshA esterase domain